MVSNNYLRGPTICILSRTFRESASVHSTRMRLGAMYVEVRKAHTLVFSWRFSVGRTDPQHLKTRLFPRVLL